MVLFLNINVFDVFFSYMKNVGFNTTNSIKFFNQTNQVKNYEPQNFSNLILDNFMKICLEARRLESFEAFRQILMGFHLNFVFASVIF